MHATAWCRLKALHARFCLGIKDSRFRARAHYTSSVTAASRYN